MSLTLHVVRPPIGDELDVVDSYERIYRSIGIAAELWRLVGDEPRAKELEAIMAEAFDREPPRLEAAACVARGRQ